MYFFWCFFLFVAVYVAPALAFFPTLIHKPHTAIAIPILSSLLVVILVTLLLPLNLFSHTVVFFISLIFILLTLFRVRKPVWVNADGLKLLFLNLLVLLPFFVKLGTHSFYQGDEVYSWNYWAIQHYFNLPIDFGHTGAPYPQFLPKLLAYQYQLIGNIDYQLPIKALLGLFSLTLLNTLAMAYWHRGLVNKLKYGLLLLWIIFGIGLQHFFNDGYADPIMCASLLLSVYYAWLAYRSHSAQSYFWLLAIATAMVAAYAKQPGLLWLGVGLPLGYILGTYSALKKNKLSLMGVFLLVTTGVAVLWMFTEGRHFQNNGGVIQASLQHRTVYEHLGYLIEFYFIQQPFLALFLLVSCIGLIKYVLVSTHAKQKKFIVYILGVSIFPYLVLWFTFGAYQLRLGQHVVALFSLLIILTGYRGLFLFNLLPLTLKKLNIPANWVYLGLAGLSLSASVLLGYKQEVKQMRGIAWENAGQRSLRTYFGQESDQIAQTLYKNPDIRLWVPTRYLYGLFYGHTPVILPESNWTVKDFIQSKADYMITASKEVTSPIWVEQINAMIQTCPEAFKKLNSGSNRYRFVAYKINQNDLISCF